MSTPSLLGQLRPTLPPALRASTLERLRFVVELVLAAMVLSDVIHWVQVYLGYESPMVWGSLSRWLCVGVSFRCRALLRDESGSPAYRLFMTRCWLGAITVGVAFMECSAYPQIASAGVSRVCLAVTLAPILIPDSLRRSLTYSALLLLAWPIGFGLSVLAGRPPLSLAQFSIAFLSNVVAASATWLAAATVHQLREQIASNFGSYRLVRKVGSGAFGDVWEAAHLHLRRPAAIKLIKPDNRDEETLARFWREAATLSSLECPHTVRILDYGSGDDGTLYLAMEMLRGHTLEDLVQKFGPQPEARVVAILSQACLSLEEAHGQELIHRDIKPANLFLCKIGTEPDFVKVLDFGLVKPLGGVQTNLTAVDSVLGTPDCMSPEQITSTDLDARSDLYSLGCVGYYLLTGSNVFPAATLVEALTHHLYSQPEAPGQRLGRPVNGALERLILSCLSKEPQGRPASAHHLYRELQNLPQWNREDALQWWKEHPAG